MKLRASAALVTSPRWMVSAGTTQYGPDVTRPLPYTLLARPEAVRHRVAITQPDSGVRHADRLIRLDAVESELRKSRTLMSVIEVDNLVRHTAGGLLTGQ